MADWGAPIYLLGAAGCAGLLAAAWGLREPGLLGLSRLELAFSGLPPELEGYRILHVTDLHVKRRGPRERLLVELCQVEADLIAFTGDYVARDGDAVPEAVATVRDVLGGRKAFGVLGNNDYNPEIDLESLTHGFSSAGLTVLRNEGVEVALPSGAGCRLWVGGVEDPVWRLDRPERAMERAPAGAFRVLLSHSPHPFTKAAALGVPLVLAGHTHGGQIRLPLIGPVYPKNSHMTKYDAGVYRLEGASSSTTLYVSRGVGTNRLPVRFLCRPEVTLLTFKRAKGGMSPCRP